MNRSRLSPISKKRAAVLAASRKPTKVIEYAPRARATVVCTGPAVMGKATPKTPDRRDDAIRRAAQGEECTFRIVGVCNHDPATSVWCHAPMLEADRGGAIKGVDILGGIGCSACHDVIDGRAPRPAGMTREAVLLDFFYGMARSLVRLRQKGLV